MECELCEDRTCGNGAHNWSYPHFFRIPDLCRGVFFSSFRGACLSYRPVFGFSPFSPSACSTALGAIGLGSGGHSKIRSRMWFLLVLYIIPIRVHSFNRLRSIFWLSPFTPLKVHGQSYIFPCLSNFPSPYINKNLVRRFYTHAVNVIKGCIVLSSLGCNLSRYPVRPCSILSLHLDR